ncbi:hypothetical protein ACFL0O_00275 [Thermodesulfobacteriota bacterium]
MGLEKKIAKAIVIGSVCLFSLAINPNFQARDFREPQRYFQKLDRSRQYHGSGMVYGLSAGGFYASIIGGAYALLLGRKED